MQLYICEKPEQATDYARALGIKNINRKDGYFKDGDIYITWCFGHLLTTLKPAEYDEKYNVWNMDNLPIIPKKEWRWKKNERAKKQLSIVEKLIKQADEINISTDCDREGELIAVSLLEYFNYTGKRYRVLTTALDKVSIQKAIKNKKDAKHTFNDYLSAFSRQKLDWLFGMNLTMAMTLANKGKVDGVLSIGRVQTAVLNIIYQRHLEISNFKPINYFEMTANFTTPDGILKTNWVMDKNILDEKENKCIDKTKISVFADKVEGKDGRVIKSKKTRKKESPPLLHSLSELQQECNKKFNLSLSDTLDIAQSLYEKHKATTYPRSDSQYLNSEQMVDIPNVLNAIKKSDSGNSEIIEFVDKTDSSIRTKVWDDKKVKESSHHAIIPTSTPFDISKLNSNEFKVYDLIRRRYIAQFYPEAEYDSTEIEIECENEIFKTSGNMPVLAGWKEVIGKKDSNNEELPLLKEGSTVNNAEPKINSKQTKPPAPYTEATLSATMINPSKFVEDKEEKKTLKETEGIGTEATRASIVETLFTREYIKREKRNIKITEKGIKLAHFAPDNCKSVSLTALWETQLKEISRGNLNYEEFLNNQEKILKDLIDEIKSGKCTFDKSTGFIYNCINCKSGLKKIKSSKNNKHYWVCLDRENCNSIFPDNRGKPLFPEKVDQGETNHICEVCKRGSLIRKISQKKVYYWQCNDKDCRQFYSDDNMTPKIYIKEKIEQGEEKYKCFECNTEILERKSGQYGFYWNCSKCKKNFKEDKDNMKPLPPVKKPTSDFQCPKCKKGFLIERKTAKGSFWGCNQFPKCKNTAQDDNGKPKE